MPHPLSKGEDRYKRSRSNGLDGRQSVKPNIKGMSAGELLSLRDDIDHALQQMVKELEAQIVTIQSIPLVKSPGVKKPTRRGSRLAGRKVPPRYRNPANPKETWAGRGMKPRWLAAAIKGGKKLESFSIKK
jgi:DNA-binding protein H-NS